MTSKELIFAILDYCKVQGVDFETACRMLTMMHEDGVHLEVGDE